MAIAENICLDLHRLADDAFDDETPLIDRRRDFLDCKPGRGRGLLDRRGWNSINDRN